MAAGTLGLAVGTVSAGRQASNGASATRTLAIEAKTERRLQWRPNPRIGVWSCPDHIDELTAVREFGRRRSPPLGAKDPRTTEVDGGLSPPSTSLEWRGWVDRKART